MKLTESEYFEYENLYMGYCKDCDDFTRECCEPDMEGAECPECGNDSVSGVMNALLDGSLDIIDDE